MGLETGRDSCDPSRALEIVREARDHGISQFDTAQHYDQVKPVLGEAIGRLGLANPVRIISKFDPALDDCGGPNLPVRPIGA